MFVRKFFLRLLADISNIQEELSSMFKMNVEVHGLNLQGGWYGRNKDEPADGKFCSHTSL